MNTYFPCFIRNYDFKLEYLRYKIQTRFVRYMSFWALDMVDERQSSAYRERKSNNPKMKPVIIGLQAQ